MNFFKHDKCFVFVFSTEVTKLIYFVLESADTIVQASSLAVTPPAAEEVSADIAAIVSVSASASYSIR